MKSTTRGVRRVHCTLDLHGVTHEDAPVLVHRFINDHWLDGWVLHVVTGRSDRMKEIVVHVASGYDVAIQDDPWNPGEVQIFT